MVPTIKYKLKRAYEIASFQNDGSDINTRTRVKYILVSNAGYSWLKYIHF